jgi:Arc/MetJ-type ribon-helix-helix transcriptional regulator
MGRPPLSRRSETVTLKVRITEHMRSRIEALVGAKRMAAFVREAIENELKKQEAQSSK